MLAVAASLLAWSLAAAFAHAAPAMAAGSDPLHERLRAVRLRSEGVRPGTAAARSIAAELSEIGAAYLEKREFGRAVELLGEALGFDSDNGIVLALLTLAYVRQEEFDFARFYLDLALQRAPRAPPRAYEILGEVYYSWNRLEEAVLAWEHFRQLGGDNPETLKRLARARQELSLASGQRSLEGEGFTLFWDPAIGAEEIRQISERLAESYREQSDFFERRLPASQIVILYAGRAYFSLVSVPDWVSGMFDGKIRVSLDPDGGLSPELVAVLSHELAHAFVRHVSADRAPGWLHEGLAQWWEGRRLMRSEIHDAFRGRSPHPLAELNGNLARRADRAAARTNYVEALGLVEYLVEQYGSAAVACFTRDLGEGRSLAESLRLEFGLTADELFRRWKEWVRL
jgi:tetratricopeptide (TPR) repeat protein